MQQSFEHDPRNQLRRALGAGGSEIARFDYGSDRKRVEKEVYGNAPQRYVYAGDKTVAEYSGASGYETNLAKYQLGADETIRGLQQNPKAFIRLDEINLGNRPSINVEGLYKSLGRSPRPPLDVVGGIGCGGECSTFGD